MSFSFFCDRFRLKSCSSMAEAIALTAPLTQVLGRHVGREVPPEQDVSGMSGRRFLCEKTVSLIIAVFCCVSLSITAMVKLMEGGSVEQTNEANDSDNSTSAAVKTKISDIVVQKLLEFIVSTPRP